MEILLVSFIVLVSAKREYTSKKGLEGKENERIQSI